jgi:putative ABC transport system permease protein
MKADYLVTSNGPGVPAPASAALRALPGVRSVTEVVSTTVRVARDKRSAQGLSPAGLTQVLDPGVTSGSLDRLGPGTIAMSDLAVQDRHLGDVVPVVMGDGVTVNFRLVAVYSRGLGFGDVLLPHDNVVPHVDDPLAKVVLIKGAVTSAQLQSQVKGFPGLGVSDRSGYDHVQAERQQTNAEVNLVFMGLIIAFTAIAVINTLAMATADRIHEFALMRLVGATRRQMLDIMRWELAVIVLIAAGLGTGAAWLTLTGFSTGLVGSSRPSFAFGTYLAVLAGAIALGLVATVVPAQMVLRRNPAEDINQRE